MRADEGPGVGRGQRANQKKSRGMTRSMRYKRLCCAGGVLIVIAGALALWWNHRWGKYAPSSAYRDVLAAMRVGDAGKPVEAFLNLRYGDMESADNRQRAFVEFFNVDHI